jgi:hypothetical protein
VVFATDRSLKLWLKDRRSRSVSQHGQQQNCLPGSSKPPPRSGSCRSTLVAESVAGGRSRSAKSWGEALVDRSAGGINTGHASPDVSFSVLGVVAAFDPNGAMLSLGSNRRRAVLAASLVNFGHPLSVDQLIDMLWNGMPPPTASTMVHGAVAGLRKTLESTRRAGAAQLLATRGGGYVLDVDPERPRSGSRCRPSRAAPRLRDQARSAISRQLAEPSTLGYSSFEQGEHRDLAADHRPPG